MTELAEPRECQRDQDVELKGIEEKTMCFFCMVEHSRKTLAGSGGREEAITTSVDLGRPRRVGIRDRTGLSLRDGSTERENLPSFDARVNERLGSRVAQTDFDRSVDLTVANQSVGAPTERLCDTSNCGEMCGVMRAWTKRSKTLKAQEARYGTIRDFESGVREAVRSRRKFVGHGQCRNKLVVRERYVKFARFA